MSPFKLPRIYPITDREVSGLSHCEQVRQLIAGGARLIQLREKGLAPLDWLDDARKAVSLAADTGVKILINDRVDIAMVLGADGVHLGQDDLPPEAARRLLGEKAIIGFSTHSFEQAAEAVRLPIDYLAFGPIFGTTTKLDTSPVVGVEALKAVRSRTGAMPLAAIGGINSSNIASVFAAGADSAALISEIVGGPGTIAYKMQELFALYC